MPKPRLCIWASDRHKGNLVRPQRGDVVDVIDSARHPGLEVLGNAEWRIVDVDIQVDDPASYMGWLIATDDAVEGFLSWFRRESVDLDALERLAVQNMGRELAADDIINTGPGNIKAISKTKLSLPDPRIIR